MGRNIFIGLALFATGLAAQTTPSAPKPATDTTKPAAPVREPGLYTTLTTSMGSIVLRLFEKESPITVKNFTDLALGRKEFTDPKTGLRVKRRFYDGLTFHRVIPNFMIQGGDPTGTGSGGSDAIVDEFHPSLQFNRGGLLAMANAGPGTGSSQFFISETPQGHLNGKHTIFGEVVEGQDVVAQIARVPATPDENRPLKPVRIVRVAVNRVGAATSTVPAKPKTTAAKTAASKPAGAKPATPAAKKPVPAAKKPAATKPTVP